MVDGSVHAHDLSSGRYLKSFTGAYFPIRTLVVSRNWAVLLALCELQNNILLWDLCSRESRDEIPETVLDTSAIPKDSEKYKKSNALQSLTFVYPLSGKVSIMQLSLKICCRCFRVNNFNNRGNDMRND